MNAATSLANITLHQLNFIANCSNLALGIQVWNSFVYDPSDGYFYNPIDNLTSINDTDWDGPDGPYGQYAGFWFLTNGTAPDWTAFWRAALDTVIPSNQSLSDDEIANWSNNTEMFNFFDWNGAVDLAGLSQNLALQGGCGHNFTTNIESILDFEQACISQYCCSDATNGSVTHNPGEKFAYYQNWTVETACAFNTCEQSNQGNPDLGGIGVLIAYLIEASLLALSLLMYGIKLFTDHFCRKPSKTRTFLDKHEGAVIASSGIFLDAAVYFSLSISFAAVIFNYKNTPLLYEDKLGQTSTLLAIDAPIGITLLSYPWLDRRDLRVFLAAAAALMTFIIQFMFRRARSFNPETNLCLNWDSTVEGFFRDRFIVKAVWICLVFPFFVWKVVPWQFLRNSHHHDGDVRLQNNSHYPQRLRIWQRLPCWERIINSRPIIYLSYFSTSLYERATYIHWEGLIAYFLAAYALYANIYDILFLRFLRNQEKEISSTKDQAETQWGYGQILAVCVWVPVLVEYFYVLGLKMGWWGPSVRVAEREWLRGRPEEVMGYEMVQPKRY